MRAALLLPLFLTLLVAAACSSDDTAEELTDPAPAATAPESAASTVAAWDCEGDLYLVSEFRSESDDVFLFLPGESFALPHVPAASGARYADHRTAFWAKGDEAMLERTFGNVSCTRNRRASLIEASKLAGNDFWGIGNEPGWTLEIGPEAIVWVTDYGQSRHTVERPDSRSKSDSTTWQGELEGEAFAVTLNLGPCHDDMSGEEFETSVTIEHGERTYRGCGMGLH